MEDDKQKKSIDNLEELSTPNSSKIAIHYLANDDAICISGNKAGLQLLAAELLKASEQIEEIEKIDKTNPEKSAAIDININWFESNSIVYVRPISNVRKSYYSNEFDWKDAIGKYGCITVFILGVISLVVGVITIMKWLF